MKKQQYKPTKLTVGQVYNKIWIRNVIFFVFCTVFMFLVQRDNLEKANGGIFEFLMFLGTLFSLCSCFIELRVLYEDGRFFLPVARIFLFFGKLILVVLCYAVMIIVGRYWALGALLAAFALIDFVAIALLFRGKDRSQEVYLDYFLAMRYNKYSLASPIIGICTSALIIAGTIVWSILSEFDPIMLIPYAVGFYCITYYAFLLIRTLRLRKNK